MTREEEILKAYNEQKTKLGNQEHTFMRGAKWADQTMNEKACEWLELQAQFVNINAFRKAMEGGAE